jgi:hypothetical protein
MEIPVKKKIPAKPDQTLAARDPLAYIVLKAESQNGNPPLRGVGFGGPSLEEACGVFGGDGAAPREV